MSILQWNLCGFKSHRDDLRFLISRYTPSVICLQETLLATPPPPVPGYSFLHTSHSLYDTSILIHHQTPFTSSSVTTTLPCTIVRVFLTHWITVVSLYLPPSVTIDFSAFADLLTKLPRPFLILGDFNCRHTLWGDTVVNTRGRLLESFITNHNLFLLNTGSATHFDSRCRSFSCIDLSFCHPSLSLDFSWSVLNEYLFSDHHPILLSPTSYSPIPRPPRWCFSRADWSTFSSQATPSVSPSAFTSLSDLLDFFLNLVLSAALASIPQTSRPFPSKCVPWWNPDCAKALRIKRACWKKFRRRRSTPGGLPALLDFKRAHANLRRTIRKAKRDSWCSFVSSINSLTPASSVWKRIRKIAGKHLPQPSPVLSIGTQSVADPLQVAECLASHFSQISTGSHLPPQFQSFKVRSTLSPVTFTLSSIEPYNAPFTLHELHAALSFCQDTSAGPDHIHYNMIRHLSDISNRFLLAIYNTVWMEGEFPSTWRFSIVLPFVKPGKSGSLPQDYRPIALTSCLCKLFERMVNSRFMWLLESRQLLSPLQFGYRKGCSTLEPLLQLDSYIRLAFARQQSVIGVFFDLEKAYDSTWKHHILSCISSMHIGGNLGVFIQNFLQDRSFQVQLGGQRSSSYPQVEGVPQGAVLSTTLFLIAINDIVATLPTGVRSALYVDDFTIYFAASSPTELGTMLQLAISKASDWATAHGFKFSTTKTCAVSFSRCHSPPCPPLFLYGHPVPYRSSTKFLGVHFDSRLSWKVHISSIKQAAQHRLKLLQTLSHQSWGADRTLLLRLHLTLVLSTLDYGCQLYSSASDSVLSTLDAVHHAGLRLALGAFKSSPVTSLYVESGIPSLYRRRALLSLKYFVRLQQSSQSTYRLASKSHPSFTSPSRLQPPFCVRIQFFLTHSNFSIPPILPLRPSNFPPWLVPTPNICPSFLPCSKSSISSSRSCALFLEHLSMVHAHATPVYTDGSRSADGTGFAVLFPERSFSFTLPSHAAVLTTELYAISFALRTMLTFPSSSFVLFTDSLSALHLLSAHSRPHPLVREIQDWLFRLATRRKSIQFCWVPSHVGIPGNEQVDALARSVVASHPSRFHSLPATDLYPVFASLLHSRWQTCWTSVSHNKLRTIKPSISPWSVSSHRNRRWEVVLARLRIGHTRLTHSHLMSSAPPPICTSCNVPLSISHIFLNCPLYTSERRQWFPPLSTHSPPLLTHFLGESDHFSIDNVMSFLQRIGILHEI